MEASEWRDMKIGDTVILLEEFALSGNPAGLVLGFAGCDTVLVFWGEDFPCEAEYYDQLRIIGTRL